MNAPVKSAHHELGPSGRSRWGTCPGSVAACRGRPNKDSKASMEGTIAHEIAEKRLKGAIEPKCSPETDAHVQGYVDYCLALGGDLKFIESRLNLTPVGIPGGWGSADYIAADLTNRVLHVADYKHGQGVFVEAEGNVQAEVYGLAALADLDWLGDAFDTVTVHIYQPRMNNVASWSFPAAEAPARIAKIEAEVAATKDPDAPRIPNQKACTFCLAKADCRELAAFALAEVTQHFENLEAELEKPSDPRRADGLSVKDVTEAYKRVPLVEGWAKAIAARAFELALDGQLAGYKIVEGRSVRKWDDEDALVEDLKKSGYGPDDYAEEKVLSPAALEKRLGKGHDVVVAHTTRSEGKPTLAPEFDKRPAMDLKTDVMAMFADETAEE